MNHYPHHIGDYLKDTAHLSLLEHGCYRRLLDVYYTREAPLPADIAAVNRLVGAQSKDERKAVEGVLREFFELLPDGWRQTRADIEILAYKEKGSKASASAQTRWQHTERNANESADAIRTHNEGNANQNQNQNQKKVKSKVAAFAAPAWIPPETWAAYLEVRTKKRAASTPYALQLAVKSLDDLRAAGSDPIACLNQSIIKGWLTFYPLKNGVDHHAKSTVGDQRAATIAGLTGSSRTERILEPAG